MTQIKNCGMKTPETIAAAVRSGTSLIGFVHHLASPRHRSITDIAQLTAYVPAQVKRVLVTTAPENAFLDAVRSIPMLDYIQIHGVTDANRLVEIATRSGLALITAMHVTDTASIAQAPQMESLSAHLLFDAPQAGSGNAFDWSMLKNVALQKPWFLAGGLHANNVAEAIRVTCAPMVDVSSGIESARGEKSEEMIAEFNAAVLNASA